MYRAAKTMCNDQPPRKPCIRLNPTGPNRRAHRYARRAWDIGLMSGLPFAEVVLLAGFLMTASMFLSVEHEPTAKSQAAPPAYTYTP